MLLLLLLLYCLQADVAAVTLSKAVEVGGSVRVISRSTAATSTGTKRKHISGASTSISGGSTHVSPDDTELLASLTEALGNKSGKRNNEIIIENVKGILQVGIFCFVCAVVGVCSSAWSWLAAVVYKFVVTAICCSRLQESKCYLQSTYF